MKIWKNGLLALFTGTFAGSLLEWTAFAESSGSTTTTTSVGSSGVMSILMMVLLIVVMYFILIRPQRKKDKETKAMQSSLLVGDEIVTIGGIVGIVVQIGDDWIVIETTGNRNKIRVKTWAIQENITVSENAKREEEEKKKLAEQKKAEKARRKKGEIDLDVDEKKGDILKD